MNVLFFASTIPRWCRKRGLDAKTYPVFEQIVSNPDSEESILSSVAYDTRCCLQQALEYGRNKGLI